jgi:hypothetical protein
VLIANKTSTGTINEFILKIISLKETLITCLIPDNLPAGTYTLIVRNPDGQAVRLVDALKIIKTKEETEEEETTEETLFIDLLFSRAFLSPSTIELGETTKIGAEVKNNGNQAASNILVALYLGNPLNNGKLLKSQTISSLEPASSIRLGGYEYKPTSSGTFYFYFVIDPKKTISESDEKNNVVIRKLVVTQPELQITRAWLSNQSGPEAPEVTSFYAYQTVYCNINYENMTPGTIISVKFYTSNGTYVTESSHTYENSGSGTGSHGSPPDFFSPGNYVAKIYVNNNYTGISLSFTVSPAY